MWRRLSHPNITLFYGIDTRHFELAMMRKCMPHGYINEFLKWLIGFRVVMAATDSNGYDRTAQLLDIAHGLECLHSET